MPADLIRIFSDLHYGDRSSRLHELREFRPLLEGATQIVFNGDSIDTRPGPAPAVTRALRVEFTEFFQREFPAVTYLTGNHDPDISPRHYLDLAGGKVFAIHGDILFESIVPWSRDVPLIKRLITAELAAMSPAIMSNLDARLAVWRRVAAQVPQRQETERNRLKHTLHLLADTVWPPWRALRVLRAWSVETKRAAALLDEHRPGARFIVSGHTHRPGVRRLPGGKIAINTGAFGMPFGGLVVDLSPTRLSVRRLQRRRGEFSLGPPVAEFAL